jgi:hypothetical protein
MGIFTKKKEEIIDFEKLTDTQLLLSLQIKIFEMSYTNGQHLVKEVLIRLLKDKIEKEKND